MLADYPAFVRAYDLLFLDGEDRWRRLGRERRARLTAFIDRIKPSGYEPGRFDLSPDVPFASWDDLARLREGSRQAGMEGLMLKRRDSAYVTGRPKGYWFKWTRDPQVADAVLMYAQRGHGKRSSFYSDYTFGVWRARQTGAHRQGLFRFYR